MKHLYIDFDPNGVTGETHSPDYEMYTLLYAIWEIQFDWINFFKNYIQEIIDQKKEDREFIIETIMVRVLNNEDLMLFDSREDENNVEKSYCYIKQEALWQAIRDYNKFDIYSKKYKRITISYDGNKVYFDLEPFETNKENV